MVVVSYFRFDEDDKIRYKYILHSVKKKWVSCNHTAKYIVKCSCENKLHITLIIEYIQQPFDTSR